jgi:ABC-2 type transport system ATP-binding protein
MIEKCDLEPVKTKLIKQLSKGNRQRVGLAQALIHEPEILILDEPTIGLDPKQVVKIRELISKLRQNHTVVLSTHILSEVEQMCDRVIIINQGMLAFDERFENFGDPSSVKFRLNIEGDVKQVSEHLSSKGTIENTERETDTRAVYTVKYEADTDPAHISKGIIDNGWGLIEMSRMREDLEALFLETIMK